MSAPLFPSPPTPQPLPYKTYMHKCIHEWFPDLFTTQRTNTAEVAQEALQHTAATLGHLPFDFSARRPRPSSSSSSRSAPLPPQRGVPLQDASPIPAFPTAPPVVVVQSPPPAIIIQSPGASASPQTPQPADTEEARKARQEEEQKACEKRNALIATIIGGALAVGGALGSGFFLRQFEILSSHQKDAQVVDEFANSPALPAYYHPMRAITETVRDILNFRYNRAKLALGTVLATTLSGAALFLGGVFHAPLLRTASVVSLVATACISGSIWMYNGSEPKFSQEQIGLFQRYAEELEPEPSAPLAPLPRPLGE